MKYVCSLILSLAFITTVSAKTYTIRFDMADYSVNVKNGVANVEKKEGFTTSDSDIETPALPYSLFRILRPLNAATADYKISFKSVLCYENVRIEANPQTVSTNSYATSKDTVPLFARKSLNTPVKFLGDMSLYGFSYASFKITPFLYDVGKQQLSFVSEVNIIIPDENVVVTKQYISNSNSPMRNVPDFSFRSKVEEIVVNPEEMGTLYAVNNENTRSVSGNSVGNPNVEYLIVTTNSLAAPFHQLRDWKTQKGVRADIVTTSYIYSLYSSYSHTLAIKKYLYDYYSNGHNLKWVLLAGDFGYVPSPMCRIEATIDGVYTIDSTPCDYYYSCFGGSFNWDGNGNGILGETTDGVDLSPYLYVSRAPVRDTTQAVNFVQKVLAYEETGPSNYFINKVFLTGSWDLNDDRALYQGKSRAHDASVKMYNQYINNNFSGLFLYYFDTLCSPSPYNSTNLLSQINGVQHFLHMCGHGNYTYWALYDDSGNSSVFNSYGVDSLTNSFPMIILTANCHTSGFDMTTCLGESFIGNQYGAVVYVGSSRAGILNGRTAELSLGYNGMFFKKLFTDLPTVAPHRLGSVMADTKKEFIDLCYGNENGYRWLQYAINPFGDPEMPIYTNNVWSIIPSYTFEGNNITVNVPCTNCTIAMQSIDGDLYEVAKNVSTSHTFYNINKVVRFTITEDGRRPHVSAYMYPTGNLSLSGPVLICDSALYSVINLPTNASVSWSNGLYSLTCRPNYPSNSQCMLINDHYNQFANPRYAKLYATITMENQQIATLSKDIRISGWRNVSYTQYANGSYPYIGGTQASLNTPNYINPGCEIFLFSDNFKLMNITHSGVTPSIWSFNNNNSYLTFTLPSSSVGQTFTIHVRANEGEGDCNNFDISFIATTNSLNSQSSPQIEIETTEGGKYIRMASLDENSRWNLEVYNVLSGESLVNSEVQGTSRFIDTSGWKPGVYIVRCRIGDKAITEKMSIKQ